MTKYWAVLVLSSLLIAGCSCGEKPDASAPEAGKENVSACGTSPSWDPPFMAFKEIRNEMSPETPTVGQIVEYRIHLVPVDDLNAVSHPWIDSMRSRVAVDTVTGRVFPQRKQYPNFSINGLVYQIWYFVRSNPSNTQGNLIYPLFVGTEFISATSRVRQNAVCVKKSQEDPGRGFWGYLDNLILDNQSDTVTLKMRFENPGRYSLGTRIQFHLALEWQGQDEIDMNGGRGSETDRHFNVEER